MSRVHSLQSSSATILFFCHPRRAAARLGAAAIGYEYLITFAVGRIDAGHLADLTTIVGRYPAVALIPVKARRRAPQVVSHPVGYHLIHTPRRIGTGEARHAHRRDFAGSQGQEQGGDGAGHGVGSSRRANRGRVSIGFRQCGLNQMTSRPALTRPRPLPCEP